ncbi:MAG: 2-C-methyl-D-erythritol 4-phosphate cytidylyltransferase [Chthoniobacterales bacterium]|nr:2-C-methyl-D-erythritol 4-phosphate cytidylyltransferase [Chthoniobacterales bacterium]
MPRAANVVAGGSSQRMGFDKSLAALGGQPLFLHSIRRFAAVDRLSALVLVGSKRNLERMKEICHEQGFESVQVVVGGAERVHSVLAGIEALPRRECLVAVHDAARPLIRPETIEAAYQLAERFGGAACAEPLTDTLIRANGELRVSENVPRENLWRMQTPQVFPAAVLYNALQEALAKGFLPTDETSAMLMAGYRAHILATPEWNPKITYPTDFQLAEIYLSIHNKK